MDVLALHAGDIILFSDKTCEFPDTGDLHTDWSRWFRRSIEASAKQLSGAERWIRRQPEHIFVDPACRQRFPLLPADTSACRFEHVAVVGGAGKRAAQALGGTPTLAIDPDIEGAAHIQRTHPSYRPFSIGRIRPTGTFLHVFDEIGLELVLTELDTVVDFLAYLRARRRFVESRQLFLAHGEEDLLAVWLSHVNADNEHYFPEPEVAGGRVRIECGAWSDLVEQPGFLAKKEADRPSYLWDAILDEFAVHALGGTLDHPDEALEDVEQALRTMAEEHRVARRMLGRALLEKVSSTPEDRVGVRVVPSPTQPGTTYVFLLYPRGDLTEAEYRPRRRSFLESYSFAYLHEFRDTRRIVAIGTESGIESGRSHDLLCSQQLDWTPDAEADAEEIKTRLNILDRDSLVTTETVESEYPETDPPV